MKNRLLSFGYLLVISGLSISCNRQLMQQVQVSSPDNSVKVIFSLEEGKPHYMMTKNGNKVIEPSAMGFEIMNHTDSLTRYKILSYEEDSKKETWEQPWGEFKYIEDWHNELIIHLKEKGGKKMLMDIHFRVFNDGAGFRYTFPEQSDLDSAIIEDELTQFTFPAEHQVWWIPVHAENSYYESLYRKSSISQTDTINTPATFETSDGLFLAIHEANLTDFASMTLKKRSPKQYVSQLIPWSNGVKVYAKAPFKSPWRTIIIGEKPGDLVTSTMMLNLNDPCILEDVSWIEPSKYIGIWWGMHLNKYTWGQGPKHGATTKNVMKYIDFASKNGFDGVLAEGWNFGWDGKWWIDGTKFSFTKSYPDFNMEEITSYAAVKNIRLIGHHETGGAVSNYENQLEEGFAQYHHYGVNAVKTGYVNKYLAGKEWHDSQFGVRHYRKVLETAAKYHIMIDNHEPVKGTGLQRTYPNLMTQEGGRGQEYNAWSPDGGNPPSHTTILPFTRMLAGPFDFTPGIFNFNYSAVKGTRVNTTLAKQLALYVILFSPQQMAADLPENYAGHPAFEFIRKVPCTWSDTKVLNAEIGKFVTMARKDRNSDEWYVGSITNEEARTIELDLSFLDQNKDYRAETYTDGEGADYRSDPEKVKIVSFEVNSDSKLKLDLAAGGGAAIRLIPLQELTRDGSL